MPPPRPVAPSGADDWEPNGDAGRGRRGFFALGVLLGVVGCVVQSVAPALPQGEVWYGAAMGTIVVVVGVTGIRRLARGPQWRFEALLVGLLLPIVAWTLYGWARTQWFSA